MAADDRLCSGPRAPKPGRCGRTTRTPPTAGRWLFAVADGMGGHAAGEVASAAVIESLRAHDAEVAPVALLEVLGRR